MKKDYNVTFEQEVLSEICEGVMADFLNVIKSKNISTKNTDNDLVKLYFNLARVKNDIIGSKYNTLEELKKVEGYFVFIKEYIRELKV